MNSDEQHKALFDYEVEALAALIENLSGYMPFGSWFALKEAIELVGEGTNIGEYIELHGMDLVCRRVSERLKKGELYVGPRKSMYGGSCTPVFLSKAQHNMFWRNREKLPRYQRGAKFEHDSKHRFDMKQHWRG